MKAARLTKEDRLQKCDAKRERRRKELIGIVKHGIEVSGNALQELKDDGYWEDTHTSWIAFCKENFAISKTKLFNLLKYTEVVGSLSKENQPKITTVDQALVLSKLPEKDRNGVVSKAESNGGITAENLKFYSAKPVRGKHVTDKVANSPESGLSSSESTESKPPSKPKSEPKPSTPKKESVILDGVKTPISSEALPYWNKRDEVQGFLTRISDIRSDFKKAAKGDQPLYSRVYQNTLDYLSRAYHVISDCKPYTLCTRCMGSPSLQPEGCSFCCSTGMISRIRWKNNADPRVKQLRMLSNAEYAAKHNLEKPVEEPEEVEEM